MYELADKKIAKLKKITWNKFLRYKAITKFDELNVIRASKRLYKELYDINIEYLLEVAKNRYNATLIGKGKTKINDEWLIPLLLAYNPVTNYVYNNEFDRKRDRYVESVLSSGNTLMNTRTAYRYIENQMEQSFIDIEDKAMFQAYEDDGVEYLKWVTEKDDRVCEICRSRDGKVYKTINYPTKPHIRCRCHPTNATKEEYNAQRN